MQQQVNLIGTRNSVMLAPHEGGKKGYMCPESMTKSSIRGVHNNVYILTILPVYTFNISFTQNSATNGQQMLPFYATKIYHFTQL